MQLTSIKPTVMGRTKSTFGKEISLFFKKTEYVSTFKDKSLKVSPFGKKGIILRGLLIHFK